MRGGEVKRDHYVKKLNDINFSQYLNNFFVLFFPFFLNCNKKIIQVLLLNQEKIKQKKFSFFIRISSLIGDEAGSVDAEGGLILFTGKTHPNRINTQISKKLNRNKIRNKKLMRNCVRLFFWLKFST